MARGAVAALCVELLWELLGFFRSISHHLFPLVAVAKGSHFSTASAALIFILAALGVWDVISWWFYVQIR